MSETDNTLLGRWCLQRDTEAFNVLVDRYGALVYGACLRILRDPEAASDAAQESFATLARKGNLKIRSLPAWLHGVATKRSLNTIRGDSRRRARERDYSDLMERSTENIWDDISPLIDEAIDALPDRYKAVILAHYFERRSHQAIAAEFGLARRTVSYRIQRGLELIRKRLDRSGVCANAMHIGGLLGSQMPAALPSSVSHGIGKLLISSAIAPAASGASSISALTGGGWPMFAKIGIAAFLVVAPLVFWKTGSTQNGPPAVSTPAAERSARVSAPLPSDAPLPEPLVVAAEQQQSQPPAPTAFAEAGATISGHLTKSPSGEAVGGHTVKLVDGCLYGGSLDAAVVAETKSDSATGAYSFSKYPPGCYMVVVDAPKGLSPVTDSTAKQVSEAFEVVASKKDYVVDIAFMKANATLTGTLLIGGKPAADTPFELYPFRGRCAENSPCTTDAAGRFVVDGLPPFKGDVQASLTRDDGTRQVSFLVPVKLEPNASADAVFDFSWGNTSFEGKVYRWDNGVLKPVKASWDVFYQKVETDPDTGVAKGNLDGRSGDTHADGSFLIENLKPGHIVLSVWPEWPEVGGGVRHRVNFDIADGVRYVKDIVLGESVIRARAINIPPTNKDLYFSVLPGAVDPLPDGTTKDNFVQNFLHFDAMLMATTSDGNFKGFMPGTYTVIAASWPCEASAEASRAMGDEFFYTFSVAQKVVTITGYKQTIDVLLDEFEFVPRPEAKKPAN